MKKVKSEASEYTLDEEDVRNIIDNTPTIRDKVIIELLAYTGCRRAELVLLRMMDINLELDMIMMPTVKQEKGTHHIIKKDLTTVELNKFRYNRIKLAYEYNRRVPIINNDLKRDLLSYIQQLKQQRRIISTSRLIQSKKKESISEPMINIIVAKASVKAGVKSPNPKRKQVHPHMFRHTFVRYAKKYGLDYVNIQEIVGHSDISTTMSMYGKSTWNDKVSDAKKMQGYGVQ